MFKLLLGMSYFFMIYGNKLVAFFFYGVLHADGDEELLNLVCEILPTQSRTLFITNGYVWFI
ncbi:hypothetical protein HanPI659440_Chr03g0109921 [Helianthus annuus]|nr:hypothetical protein HanPI659440_Chr03g0109921 [Helianthus annuus]